MYFDRKDDIYFIKWAKQVKIRDRFICQICERRGLELNAHHMNGWDWCVEERYDLDNGTTLCKDCHTNFHDLYGYGGNTRQQFDEFVKVSETLIRAINRKIQVESLTQKTLQLIADGYEASEST
jgi:hypothetical protein